MGVSKSPRMQRLGQRRETVSIHSQEALCASASASLPRAMTAPQPLSERPMSPCTAVRRRTTPGRAPDLTAPCRHDLRARGREAERKSLGR